MKARCRGWQLVGAALSVLVGFAPVVALAEPGPTGKPGMSALNPNAPAPQGFIGPTLEGDWRFRIALNGWAPTTIEVIATTPGGGGGDLEEDLGWLLDNLKYYVPFDFETRKGSFGVFFHTLFMGLDGQEEILGPIELDWNLALFVFDVGLSYELGRWKLWDQPKAPELTLEPYFEARIVHLPVSLSVLGIPIDEDLSSQVPVLGMRAFIDLTEHWNLEFIGDYGGFGVDDNHQTYQGAALVGYRWKGWGAHWNFQVGYRAMRLFEMRQDATDISMDARGPDIVFGVQF